MQLLVGLALAAAACSDATGPGQNDGSLAFMVMDAAHHDGVDGFYFLPPMVRNPRPFEGEFDGTLEPSVAVFDGATCEGPALRWFLMGSASSEALRLDDQSYSVLWHTRNASLLATRVPDYRICVFLGDALIGWADLDVVADRNELMQVGPDYVGLVRGWPLLIKFRIEEGVGGPVDEPVAPVAAADAGEYEAATPLAMAAGAGGLLDNDDLGDPAAALLSFGGGDLGGAATDHAAGSTVAPLPGHADGSLTVGADGAFNFVPPSAGPATFQYSYRIGNSAGTSDAQVTFTAAAAALVASDDDYPANVIGNVGTSSAGVGGGFSVLANDQLTAGATITAYDAASANGGTITMVTAGADAGTFTYSPARGFEGDDSFTYTLEAGAASATATVRLVVSGMIWFIDNGAGACASSCDGRLTNPYPTLAAFAADNDGAGSNPDDGDAIFLFENGTPYEGPVALRHGQSLFGQDASADLATVAGLPGSTGAILPAMALANATHTVIGGPAGVVLGADNTVRGLRVDVSAGAALSGAAVGALTIIDVARLAAAGGPALDIQSATNLTATIGTLVSTASSGTGVHLSGIGAGALSVTGPVVVSGSAGTGVRLLGGTASLTFGALDVVPGNGARGLHVTDYSGVITAGGGVIATSGATAVDVSSAGAATPLAIVLTSVSSDGGMNGIRLNRTSGTFEVRGDGASDPSIVVGQRGRTTAAADGGTLALGSGGTIRNTTVDGVSLEETVGVTLRNMIIGDAAASASQPADGTVDIAGNGVAMANVTGVLLDNMLIARTGGHAVHGMAVTDLGIVNSELLNAGDAAGEDAVSLLEPRGVVSIANTVLAGMWGRGVSLRVDGKSSTAAPDVMSIANASITNGHASGGGGIFFDSQASSHYRIDVADAVIEQVSGEGITVVSQGNNAADRSRAHVGVQRTRITELATAVRVLSARQGAATFDIRDNNADAGNGGGFTAMTGPGIVVQNESNGELAGVLDANLVTSAAEPLTTVANGTSGGLPVTGTTRVRITNNTLTSTTAHGMSLMTQNGNVALHALIGGNTATAGGGFFDFNNGIYIETRSGTGCFNMSAANGAGSNAATGSGPGMAEGVFLLGTGGLPRLQGLPAANDGAAQTFLDANNASNAASAVFTGDMVAAAVCSVS